jgi:hypothetical protein
MGAKSSTAGSAEIERAIVDAIGAAGLRLRFDKVAVRLVANVKAALLDIVPDDHAVVFTITAPIRLPSRTAAAIEDLVRGGFSGHELRETVHGNQLRIRRVTGVAAAMPRVMGFVHNPDADPGAILAFAEERLRGQDRARR